MRAAVAFAFRRTSARLVFAVGAGGVVLVVYRAVRPRLLLQLGLEPPTQCAGCVDEHFFLGSSPWDLVAASLGLVAAVAIAVALYRVISIRR